MKILINFGIEISKTVFDVMGIDGLFHQFNNEIMNALRNTVQLIGRLGQDPEIISFPDAQRPKMTFNRGAKRLYTNDKSFLLNLSFGLSSLSIEILILTWSD